MTEAEWIEARAAAIRAQLDVENGAWFAWLGGTHTDGQPPRDTTLTDSASADFQRDMGCAAPIDLGARLRQASP